MAREKPIPRREFLKRIAVATGAVVLGPAGKAQARKKRGKVDLHFGYGRHTTRKHGEFYLKIADRAAARGEPFDFLVIETSGLPKEKRPAYEKLMNDNALAIREKFGEKLKRGEINPIVNALVKQGVNGYYAMLMITAAKHDLIIKAAEEYASEKRVKELREKLTASGNKFRKTSVRQSTGLIHSNVTEGFRLFQEYIIERNRIIADTVSNSVAEIRKSGRVKKRKRLRGLVVLGASHHMVDDIISVKGKRGMRITEEFIESESRLISEEIRKQLRASRIRVDTPECAHILSLAFSIDPMYVGYRRLGKKAKALELVEKLMRLTPEKAEEIYNSIAETYGETRVIKILQQL